jgi:hypothetical protein
MKKIITLSLLWIIVGSHLNLFGQSFNESGSCEINVYDPYYNTEKAGIINATVKIIFNGGTSGCTGTLINRNTSDSEVGFYILSARHCIDEMDANAVHYVIFNYQSPDANNASTPESNQGKRYRQSTSLTDSLGYEYFHRTKIRIVDYFFWGDFALLELLTPVPPHFNISYAGWSPSVFNMGPNLLNMVGIHHPRGDIKKISGVSSFIWGEIPLATGCYTVTTIIDFLFGWIWGHRWSTKVICNYADNPWIIVSNFSYGITEHGSSGSGLFYSSGRIIGMLSGGWGECGTWFEGATYGKLRANYFNRSVKSVLNPPNEYSVDLFGMDGRKVSSYENLTLPGASLTHGYYFPANHYQSENKIVLQAKQKIITTDSITIFQGADYEFVAGEKIVLGPGFHAQAGSYFKASISPPASMQVKNIDNEQKLIDKLKAIEIPQKMNFDIHKYTGEALPSPSMQESDIFVSPNPFSDFLSIAFHCNEPSFVSIYLYDITGRIVKNLSNSVNYTSGNHKLNFDVSDLQKGIYLLQFISNRNKYAYKLVKI